MARRPKGFRYLATKLAGFERDPETGRRRWKQRDPEGMPFLTHPLILSPAAVKGGRFVANVASLPAAVGFIDRLQEEMADVGEERFEESLRQFKAKNPDVHVFTEAVVPAEDILERMGDKAGKPGSFRRAFYEGYAERLSTGNWGPAYDPNTRAIYMRGSKSPSILAHEAGHATGNRFLHSTPVNMLRSGVALGAGLGSLTNLAKAYYAHNPEDRERALARVRNYQLAGMGTHAGVLLTEEARATARALRGVTGITNLSRARSARLLRPAYASHAIMATVPYLFTAGIPEILRRKALRKGIEAGRIDPNKRRDWLMRKLRGENKKRRR